MVEPRRVFRSRALERRFRRDGYVVVPFAPPEVLDELRTVHESMEGDLTSGYHASMHSTDLDHKRVAHEEVSRRFWPLLDALLDDHELLVGAFMIKHPGEDSWVPPHQDWIVTDESTGAGINCWVPITPVTDAEGRMSILPGSHRYVTGLRGSPAFPTRIGPLCRQIADELLEPVQVDVGEAIIYDNRLVHGTPPNRSDADRIVAYVSAIPTGAARLHYYIDAEGTVEAFEVGRDFFTSFNLGDRPTGEPFERIPGYRVPEFSMDELRELSRRAGGWRRRVPALR